MKNETREVGAGGSNGKAWRAQLVLSMDGGRHKIAKRARGLYPGFVPNPRLTVCGKARVLRFDMTSAGTGSEGMACCGRVRLLIEPVV